MFNKCLPFINRKYRIATTIKYAQTCFTSRTGVSSPFQKPNPQRPSFAFYSSGSTSMNPSPAKSTMNSKPSHENHTAASTPKASLQSKLKNDMTLICSTLDSTGKLINRSQPISKSLLCSSYGLLPRDVRKLDGTLKNQLPTILVRPKSILINLESIKAIIKADTVILVETGDFSEKLFQSNFLFELQSKLHYLSRTQKYMEFKMPNKTSSSLPNLPSTSGGSSSRENTDSKTPSTSPQKQLLVPTRDSDSHGAQQSPGFSYNFFSRTAPFGSPVKAAPSSENAHLLDFNLIQEPSFIQMSIDHVALPFEFQVLETILVKVCSSLQESLDELSPKIDQSLVHLESSIHWDKLQILLRCKRSINRFQRRVEGFRNCLVELLNSDSDMAGMYLSEKEGGEKLPRESKDHDEMELLLESYLKIIEEVAARVEELSRNMESTEDIVNIGLIVQRNELLLLELRLSIGTFAVSMGALVASVFGMNLHSGLETHPFAFYSTTGILSVIVLGSLGICASKLRKLVRKY